MLNHSKAVNDFQTLISICSVFHVISIYLCPIHNIPHLHLQLYLWQLRPALSTCSCWWLSQHSVCELWTYILWTRKERTHVRERESKREWEKESSSAILYVHMCVTFVWVYVCWIATRTSTNVFMERWEKRLWKETCTKCKFSKPSKY